MELALLQLTSWGFLEEFCDQDGQVWILLAEECWSAMGCEVCEQHAYLDASTHAWGCVLEAQNEMAEWYINTWTPLYPRDYLCCDISFMFR